SLGGRNRFRLVPINLHSSNALGNWGSSFLKRSLGRWHRSLPNSTSGHWERRLPNRTLEHADRSFPNHRLRLAVGLTHWSKHPKSTQRQFGCRQPTRLIDCRTRKCPGRGGPGRRRESCGEWAI